MVSKGLFFWAVAGLFALTITSAAFVYNSNQQDGDSLLSSRVDESGSIELNDIEVDGSFVLKPQNKPNFPSYGEIYLDNDDGAVKIYNGNDFVELADASADAENDPKLPSCENSQSIQYRAGGWACLDLDDEDDGEDNDDEYADNQTIILVGDTLSIIRGNSVQLTKYLDNTDNQTLSLSGSNVLTVSGGNSVNLSTYLDNTDELASLSCSSGQVAQWNTAAWVCASAGVDTDDQTLSIDGSDNLLIADGNQVSLGAYLDNIDAQAISVASDILSISGNASTVDLSAYLDDTTLGEAAVEAFIFDGDNAGTISSGTLALSSLSFTGELTDLNISNALTLGASSSVADGALSANVSLLGPAISGAEILNGSIEALDFETTNSATDNYVLSYDNATGGFTWIVNGSGSDATTASNGLTETGDDIALGGQLSGATTIDLNNNNIDFDLESGGDLRVGTTTGGAQNTGKYLNISGSGTHIGYELGVSPSYAALHVVEEQEDINGFGQRLIQRATSTTTAITSSALQAQIDFTGDATYSNNAIRGVLSEVNGSSSGGSGGTGSYAIGVDADVGGIGVFEYAIGLSVDVDISGGAADRAYGIYVDDVSSPNEEYGIYQYGSDDTNVFAGDTRIGGSTTAPPKLFVLDNPTNETNVRHTVGISTTGSSTTADTTTVTGLYNHVNHPINAGGSNTSLFGTDTTIAVRGTGTTDLAVAYDAFIDGDGTATDAYAYRADIDPWPAGSITNGYGLYVEDLDVTNGYGVYQNGSDDSNYFAGNVGIGTTPTSYELQLGSDSAAKPGTSTWTIASDARLKNVLGEYTYGLNELRQIDVVNFVYKEGNGAGISSDEEYSGVIAQQLQSVMPETVRVDEDGYLWVDTDPIRWAQLNAIKELDEKLIVVETNPVVETLHVKADATFEGDILVGGHIVSTGNTPAIVFGDGLSGSLEGTDTAGVIVVEVSQETSGLLAAIHLSESYSKTPVVTFSAVNADSAAVRVYYDATKDTVNLMSVDKLVPGSIYRFSYIIVE